RLLSFPTRRSSDLLEMFCAACLWLGLVILPWFAPTVLNYGPLGKSYWLTAGLTLLVVHSIDGMMTHHFARKGHHPSTKPPETSSESTTAPTLDMPKPDLIAAKKALSLRREQAGEGSE